MNKHVKQNFLVPLLVALVKKCAFPSSWIMSDAICCDLRSGIDQYSTTNERKNRVKNTRWRSHRVFFTRFFLEFGVNIWNSAERSSAYCHYSSFFGRHNQQWWIRANIQHFSQYCGTEKRGIMGNIAHVLSARTPSYISELWFTKPSLMHQINHD